MSSHASDQIEQYQPKARMNHQEAGIQNCFREIPLCSRTSALF